MAKSDAQVDRALGLLRQMGATIPNTPQLREVMAALLDAEVNRDVDNSKLPLKLGSRLSE
jgi:hypothetical protein